MCLFFEQRAGYEVLRSLVGSEMCIGDRDNDDQQDKQEWLERRSRMIEDVQE